MIPEAYINHWRNVAPWPQDAQVEQDLVLSRAIIEIFSNIYLSTCLVMRGGTALYKFHMTKAKRYSEDIDLVQINSGAIGKIIDAIRQILDPFLGEPKRETSLDNVTLRYRFDSEIPPVTPLRLKIEINTREHFSVFNIISNKYKIDSPWFIGIADIKIFCLEELLATKLRALYQRRKGRDLFDIWTAINETEVDFDNIIKAFKEYMKREGNHVSRKMFEENLDQKIKNPHFIKDLKPLVSSLGEYDLLVASEAIKQTLLHKL